MVEMPTNCYLTNMVSGATHDTIHRRELLMINSTSSSSQQPSAAMAPPIFAATIPPPSVPAAPSAMDESNQRQQSYATVDSHSPMTKRRADSRTVLTFSMEIPSPPRSKRLLPPAQPQPTLQTQSLDATQVTAAIQQLEARTAASEAWAASVSETVTMNAGTSDHKFVDIITTIARKADKDEVVDLTTKCDHEYHQRQAKEQLILQTLEQRHPAI